MTGSTTGDLGTITVAGATCAARFERVLAHPTAAVWTALTDAGALARWLVDAEIEPRTGGDARFDFGDGPRAGSVVVWEPPRRLVYRWPYPDDVGSVVSWTLEPADDGASTRLVLEHTRLPRSWAEGYASGWHAYLERLDAHLGGGQLPDWTTRVEELRPRYGTGAASGTG